MALLPTPLDVRSIRHELELSQSSLADLLGVSVRTVQSWEQGWRQPGSALERTILLLIMTLRQGARLGSQTCWDAVDCRKAVRDRCLVFRSGQGHLCWFLTGNTCKGRRLGSWADKKEMCMECKFFRKLFRGTAGARKERRARQGADRTRPWPATEG